MVGAVSLGGEFFFSSDGDAALVPPSGGVGSSPGGLNGNIGNLTSSSLCELVDRVLLE